MAKFMDVHDGFFGVTASAAAEAHQRDLDIEDEEGVHYEHAWLDPESGKVFCLATGPSKEAVMRVHETAGHPTPQVYEVPIEVSWMNMRASSADGWAAVPSGPPPLEDARGADIAPHESRFRSESLFLGSASTHAREEPGNRDAKTSG